MTLDTCFTPIAPQVKIIGTAIGFHLWDAKKEQVLPHILRSILTCTKTKLSDNQLARYATYLVQEEWNRVNTAQAKAMQADKAAGLAFRHQKSFLTTLLKDKTAWRAAFEEIRRPMPDRDHPLKHARQVDEDDEPEEPTSKKPRTVVARIDSPPIASRTRGRQAKLIKLQARIESTKLPAKAPAPAVKSSTRARRLPKSRLHKPAPIVATPRLRMRDVLEDSEMDSDMSEDEGLIQSGKGVYIVIQHLQKGGEGRVDLAKHHRTGQLVAIKTPLKPDLVIRMQAEAQLMLKARAGKEPNIVHFYGFEKLGGSCQMALELAHGDLLDLVANTSHIDLDVAAYIMRDATAGIEALHSRNIAHRDVKMENFLVVKRDNAFRVVVSDLGHAKDMSDDPLGRTTSVVGTIGKRSPEMDEGEYLPKPVDVWALGIVLYELLECKHPWSGSSVESSNEAALNAWIDEHMQVLQLSPANDHWTADLFLRQTVYKHAKGRPTARQLLRSPLMNEACSSERFQQFFGDELDLSTKRITLL